MTTPPLLAVENLKVQFPTQAAHPFARPGIVKAVDDISFTLRRGETLGLVGESGCGKSTTGNAIVQLVPATAGRILIDGRDITQARGRRERLELARRGQMIFQDAYASLDPRMTIEDILQEPLRIHRLGDRAERHRRIGQLLDNVGLAQSFRGRYPHEMSGGQLQRIGIARALAVQPDFIVCDEPVSALDVSVQAQIVNLLEDLQREFGIALVFISHDLSVVRHLSHRIAVMYLGRIVETGDATELYERPAHPYTKALLSAVSVPDPAIEAQRRRERILLSGETPSPENMPAGCRFKSRCPAAVDACATADPALAHVGTESSHEAACIRLATTGAEGLRAGAA